MADSTAALTEQQNVSDWAAAFQSKFNAVCRRPSHTQLDYPDAPSPTRKWGKPEIVNLQRPDSPSGPPQAFPIRDATSKQSRGEPRAARQRSSPQPIRRATVAVLRVRLSLPH
ncbi:Hypothetical predicted protein [Pelobates cultripes]|uniref:Uncharacterized protein n=1 Tax=Pelobates cultripes TaxID=61616 RepID=A0AAD1S7B3_PELCU|nr:Hypothetical predicted protein [Pelobates cultripes]